MKLFRKTTIALLCTALIAPFTSVQAVSLSPIYLVITGKSKSAILVIDNSDGDSEVVYDVRVHSWDSVNDKGENILSDTTKVYVRPVVNVPPHKHAEVKLMALDRTTAAQDNYRVSVQDITPAKDGSVSARVTASLPLFVVNDKNAHGNLELLADGSVKNTGNRHIRIAPYLAKDGVTKIKLRYVLPGQTANIGISSLSDIVYNDNLY